MSSLDTYRELVPGHASIDDDVIESYLDIAARQHNAAAFGVTYPEAMVWWVASRLEPLRLSGAIGLTDNGTGCVPPPKQGKADNLKGEPYWSWYVECRDKRAASGPRRVVPWL